MTLASHRKHVAKPAGNVASAIINELKDNLRKEADGSGIVAVSRGTMTNGGKHAWNGSDIDLGIVDTERRSGSRLDLVNLAAVTKALGKTVADLGSYGIHPVISTSFVFETFAEELAMRGVSERNGNAKVVILDCMFYPTTEAAIGWSGSATVSYSAPFVISSFEKGTLFFGGEKDRSELVTALRKAEVQNAARTRMGDIIHTAEKLFSDTYILYIANHNLPEDMRARDSLRKLKVVAIFLTDGILYEPAGAYPDWSSLDGSKDRLPKEVVAFIESINELRGKYSKGHVEGFPKFQELEELFRLGHRALEAVSQKYTQPAQ